MKTILMSLIVSVMALPFASAQTAIPGAISAWDANGQYNNAIAAVKDYAADSACMSNVTVADLEGTELLLVTDSKNGNSFVASVGVNIFKGKWVVRRVSGDTSCK